MALTGIQRDQMHQALLAAYNRDEMRYMLRVRMSVDFDHVVAEKLFADQVWDLVCWADRAGRSVELAQSAAADKPQQSGLQALLTDTPSWDPSPAPNDSPAAQGNVRTTIIAQVDDAQNVAIGTNIRQEIHQHYHAAPAPSPLRINVPPPPPQPPIGRETLVTTWIELLTSGQTRTLAIHGMPGAGKTTLAILLAHDERLRSRYPDGVLWASLGPSSTVEVVQTAWAERDALDVDLAGTDITARQERLNRAVGERRLLVVLDDVWDLAAAQALRLGGADVAHILTTRNEEIALGFALAEGTVRAEPLQGGEAWALLQRIAPAVCAAAPALAREVLATVGGLPLGVELLGGYLAAPQRTKFASQRTKALAAARDPAERLHMAGVRLGSATGQTKTLEAMVLLSVDDMAKTAPEAVPVFWALGAFAPMPATFDLAAAAAVAMADEDVLALLAGRNLLELGADEKLAVHQVVQDVMAAGTPAEATKRHAHYYISRVEADPEDWRGIEQMYPQVHCAWEKADDERRLAYLWALSTYFERRGLRLEQIAWVEKILPYAEAQLDTVTVAQLLSEAGAAYADVGDRQHALDCYGRALGLSRQAGDKAQEITVLNSMGLLYAATGDRKQALDVHEQALQLSREVGDKDGIASNMGNIGLLYAAQGNQRRALACYGQALAFFRQGGYQNEAAIILNNIGEVYASLGDRQRALRFYLQALPMHRQAGNLVMEATTLNNIGAVHSDLGNRSAALEQYLAALPLLRQIRHKVYEATLLCNIGRVYGDLGDMRLALDYFEQALPLHRQVGDRRGESRTLYSIAMAARSLGDLARAEAELIEVVGIDEAAGHPELAGDRSMLAQVQSERRESQSQRP